MSAPLADNASKVKVYALSLTGSWDSCGVGAARIDTGAMQSILRVDFEPPAGQDGQELPAPPCFEMPISTNDSYRLEGDESAIIQVERYGGTDVAFSFQTPQFANACWAGIMRALGLPPSARGSDGGAGSSGVDAEMGAMAPAGGMGVEEGRDVRGACLVEARGEYVGLGAPQDSDTLMQGPFLSSAQAPSSPAPVAPVYHLISDIPQPLHENLHHLLALFENWDRQRSSDVGPAYLQQQHQQQQRCLLGDAVLGAGPAFLKQLLVHCLEQLEQLGPTCAGLATLSSIVWCLLCSKHSGIIGELISDDFFESVLGALEYDRCSGGEAGAPAGGSDARTRSGAGGGAGGSALLPACATAGAPVAGGGGEGGGGAADAGAPPPPPPAACRRWSFRQHFRSRVAFCQVIPEMDEDLVTLIQQAWRLHFLSDILGPLSPDEGFSMWVMTGAYTAQSDVLSEVLKCPTLLPSVLALAGTPRPSPGSTPPPAAEEEPEHSIFFRDESSSSSSGTSSSSSSSSSGSGGGGPVIIDSSTPSGALGFLSEVVRLSRDMQLGSKVHVLSALEQKGRIYSVLQTVLGNPWSSLKEVLQCMEILSALVSVEPLNLRDFCRAYRVHPPNPDACLAVLASAPAAAASAAPAPAPADASGSSSSSSSSSSSTISPASRAIRPWEREASLGLPQGSPLPLGEHGSLCCPPREGAVCSNLLLSIVRRAVDDPDERVQGLAISVLRLLLDAPQPHLHMAMSSPVDTDWISLLFEKYFPWLFAPFFHALPPYVELPPPVEAMKRLDAFLNSATAPSRSGSSSSSSSTMATGSTATGSLGIAPLLLQPPQSPQAPAPALSLPQDLESLLVHMRRGARTIQEDILPHLLQQPQQQALGMESTSSRSSKAMLVEFLLELLTRYPAACQAFIQKYALHLHILPLVCYGEQHMVLWGIKFMRALVGCPAIAFELVSRHLFNYCAHVLLKQVLKRRTYTMLVSVVMELVRHVRGGDNRPMWLSISRQYNPLLRLLTALGTFVDVPATSPAVLGSSPTHSSLLLRGFDMGAFGRGGGSSSGGGRMGGQDQFSRYTSPYHGSGGGGGGGGAGSGGRGGKSYSGFGHDDEDESYFKEQEVDRHGSGGPLVPAGARASAHAPMLLPTHHQTAAASDFDF